MVYFFFFQAEDGIRDATVTGVQTCALPIYPGAGVLCGSGTGAAAIAPEGGRGAGPAARCKKARTETRGGMAFSAWLRSGACSVECDRGRRGCHQERRLL